MIDFERFTLANGLKVIVHRDTSTPMACVNILYDVGARDEDPERTGFAHLFEHLMFGGSVNIPDYDNVLQQAGGENNAFTTNDITNYYLTLPAVNLEVAFWLESDRMLSLGFSEKSLEVQRNVVIEEFKQSYLNQPYGDIWLEIPKLAYKVHPYLWPTIGKNIDHIKYAVMDDVKAFFKKFYCPNNAILCVTGNLTVEQVKVLCEKWFAPIPMGNPPKRNLPVEPPQTEARKNIRTEGPVAYWIDRLGMVPLLAIAGAVVLFLIALLVLVLRKPSSSRPAASTVALPRAPEPAFIAAPSVAAPAATQPVRPAQLGTESFGTLFIASGPLSGNRFQIPPKGLLIGRDPSLCAVILPDDTVSKEHAWVVPLDNGVVVIDRSSVNGTYVNSIDSPRIGKMQLKNGDRIFIGRKNPTEITYFNS